ncbi:MAG: DNA mismatch repair protein MutS [Alphaproteobacteria bacterium]|jgi:DNA mismatch repair protein MutS
MASPTPKNLEATPVIAQYLAIKQDHQDCLVFFQMGDFYELFFEDAKIAATELDIVLTYRGTYNDQDIPMCGVPVHNYASYSEKLVQKGYKIAICAQTESPIEAKKRGYKAIVNRQVIRIVTAGTLTEDHLLDARHDNFLCVVATNETHFCCFFYDISTGKIHYFNDIIDILKSLINHKKPSEIIYHQQSIQALLSDVDISQTMQAFPKTDQNSVLLPILTPYAEAMSDLQKQAIILLSHYLKRTQCSDTLLMQAPEIQVYGDFLQLDDAGQANLEIFKTLSGQKKPTLLSTLDCCKTASGARLLADQLNFPITSQAILNNRYDAIGFFLNNPMLAENLQLTLKKTADLNRILGRVKTGRSTPADLGYIRNSLHHIYTELPQLQLEQYNHIPPYIIEAYNGLCVPISSYGLLQASLKEVLPISLKIGDFIQSGYDGLLDEYKTLKENARQFILELEQKYKDITQISVLKIKHNNVIGYHIDVSSNHSEKMFHQEFTDITFIHKQTLANHVRFTTNELIGLEKKISEASLFFDQREKELFLILCQSIEADIAPLLTFANAIASLDLYASHGLFALENNYCRPQIVDKKTLHITDGRHSVVEHLLKKQSKNFIPNNATFKHGTTHPEIWLVTGPNMGGKSTYLRQTVLIIIMAQAGLFVPATAYQAGIFDKIFSRVGASDNLAEGKSTFMSEMSETALILKNATPQSFVILDELGRGTSTYDGLAIAHATLKYLSETIGAMGLFATHYHELTQMISHHKRIGNLQATVTHHDNAIIFLHKIAAGAAKQSYGIHVAELAGMPLAVIRDATEFLNSIDKQKAFPKASHKTSKPNEKETGLLFNDIRED